MRQSRFIHAFPIGFAVACATATSPYLAWAGSLSARIVDSAGHPVEDAIVLAKPAGGAAAVHLVPHDEIVDQIDKEFVPHVKPVVAGSLVRFPNKDNIRHHVYSFSPAKKFELPLYAGTAAPPVRFDKPGVVVLGCNIHDWMLGYIYVADTPYFGKTGREGTAAIENLPEGEYLVRVWQPDMEGNEAATERRVTLAKDGTVELQWQLKLKPVFRKRRSPVPGGPGYR